MKKQLLLLFVMMMPLVASADTWDGVSSDKSWYDENATEYHIYAAAQLKGFAELVNEGISNFQGKTLYLESDIDLGKNPWTPIGYGYFSAKYFCGVFNGNNHTISNIYISTNKLTGTYYGTGFFGMSENAEFLNIFIQGEITHNTPSVMLGEYVGGLVASAVNSKIENIRCNMDINFVSDGSWSVGGPCLGLVAGRASTISKTKVTGNLRFTNCGISSGMWGGIAGRVSSVNECCSDVSMIIPHNNDSGNTPCVGGISGYTDKNIKNSIFSGSISVNYQGGTRCYTGGICGMGETGIEISNVISAPTYFYSYAPAMYTCLINRSANPTVSYAYYANKYAGSYETYGTGVSEDYLKSGAILDGFDKNIWEFTSGKYPRLKALIPTYSINSPLEHGTIAYCVKEGDDAIIKVNVDQGWVIEKVYVNQIDVTDQMSSNQLVFSDIQENKTIFVVYQQAPAGVQALQKNTTFSISNSSDGFVVSGVPTGKSIAVYDLNGIEVMRQSSIGENHFALRKGFYIVSANGMSKKVTF